MFRLWRRIKILPGVRLNLSKSGVSVSLGVRGANFTVRPKGTRATVTCPPFSDTSVSLDFQT